MTSLKQGKVFMGAETSEQHSQKIEPELIKNLVRQAFQARVKAYAPYSGFLVGAALLSEEGKVYTGCNIENAAYGPSNCAERTAFFKAVSEGSRRFTAIAVVGGLDYIFPCGVCRQVMAEFCGGSFLVIAARSPEDYCCYEFGEIFPHAFGPGDLAKGQ